MKSAAHTPYDGRNDGRTDADAAARADERRVAVPADEPVGRGDAGRSGAVGPHDAAGEVSGGARGLAGSATDVASAARLHISVGTSRKLCRHVAERWRSQYGEATPERFTGVQEKLDALGKDGTKAEIDAIIGNPTWTTEMCEVCERNVEKWAVLGEHDDTLTVCEECLEDAKVEVENAS